MYFLSMGSALFLLIDERGYDLKSDLPPPPSRSFWNCFWTKKNQTKTFLEDLEEMLSFLIISFRFQYEIPQNDSFSLVGQKNFLDKNVFGYFCGHVYCIGIVESCTKNWLRSIWFLLLLL